MTVEQLEKAKLRRETDARNILSNIYPPRVAQALSEASPYPLPAVSSYAEVYLVIYDSGSVPRRVIFSPRETSANQP